MKNNGGKFIKKITFLLVTSTSYIMKQLKNNIFFFLLRNELYFFLKNSSKK